MIDLATLTGRDHHLARQRLRGPVQQQRALAGDLLAASEAEGEAVWRMPMPRSTTSSSTAPRRRQEHRGAGAGGGSILAALFLQRFVRDDCPGRTSTSPGTTWRKKSDHPSYPKAQRLRGAPAEPPGGGQVREVTARP
jgi:leucyl aminopeptidase